METNEVHLVSLLKNLVECSEKASRIAQICRSNEELFSLLIQEKKNDEKNMRFVHDFKTLADVLVQETIRWNISKQFPPLHSTILGEENNHFENTLGESIEVRVFDSAQETINLLTTVLDGRQDSARALCEGIYEKIDRSIDVSESACNLVLSGDAIGIWIDPIDCTGEYIYGCDKGINSRLAPKGLHCVCVVIGVYDLHTGYPIAGVVNQPFFAYNSNSERWESKYYWGLCHRNCKQSSLELPLITPQKKKKIVASSCENENLLKICASRYDVYPVAGSGYKALLVACGDADFYVLSQPTTYFWDTCGPNALLASLGGGIIDFKRAVSVELESFNDLLQYHLKYIASPSEGNKTYCNAGGVIAYRDPNSLMELLHLLKEYKFHEKQ